MLPRLPSTETLDSWIVAVGDRSKDGTGVLLSGSAVIFSPGVKVDGFAAVARTSVLLGGTFVVELEILEDATNTINRPNNISKNNTNNHKNTMLSDTQGRGW